MMRTWRVSSPAGSPASSTMTSPPSGAYLHLGRLKIDPAFMRRCRSRGKHAKLRPCTISSVQSTSAGMCMIA